MNPSIAKLFKMAECRHRHIIGLMSGTSLDGLDLAYCKIVGSGRETKVEVLAYDTISYSEDVRSKIRQVFAKKEVHFPFLAILNEWIGNLHGEMVNDFIAKMDIDRSNIDVIASHGQTVMHVPKHQHNLDEFPNATLQIGDGDQIAVKTGLITISDFRQKHVAAGGEGAPLAVYGDYLVFSSNEEERLMLNIGGIANFTYLPKDDDASKVFVTDTGPGNTLMDTFVKNRLNLPYDNNGEIASTGHINQPLLEQLKSHSFFALPFPKTTGPEQFNAEFIENALLMSDQINISVEDIMATLARFTAETISQAILKIVGNEKMHIYMSGGGMHNPLLCSHLKELLPLCDFSGSDALGIPGDAKEAVLFAVLANETLAGHPIDFGIKQGVPGICMGKISLPN